MSITKLELKNFRSFKSLSLDGLSPVTLIAGTNNVGKSTILEALFLYMGRVSSDIFLRMNAVIRGIQIMPASPAAIWEHFFYNFATNDDIVITLENSGERESTTLSRDDSFAASSIVSGLTKNNVPLIPVNGETYIPNGYPLKVCRLKKSKQEISRFMLTNTGQITLSFEQPFELPPQISYIGPNFVSPPSICAEYFSKIEQEGKSASCVEILQILEKRIKDLSVGVTPGGGSSIYADIGLKKRIPINMLGGGINRLMQIAFTMIATPNSILLIDEIENGFHYSIFPKLWEIIGKTAKETNCQVFATTHSYECIRGATVLASGDASNELFRFIRLEQQNDDIVPVIFENDSLEYLIKNDWEVR